MDVTPVAPAARGHTSKLWIIIAVIVASLFGLLFCVIVGIGALSVLGKRVEPTVVTASDGQSQLTVPTNWQVQDDLNDVAELQVADLQQEQYMIVLTENKADFDDVDLEQYADLTMGILLETVETDEEPTPQAVTINGLPALQSEIRGTVDNMKVVYWMTNIEGTHNYYQVVAWTLASKAEQNRPVFQNVVQSFHEIAK